MKLLVDQNISYRIVKLINDKNWMLDHVKDLGLTDSSDFQIFQFARSNKYNAVITLDEDFNSLQLIHGVPPKIIWLRTGNCSTNVLAGTILRNSETIHDFLLEKSLDCVEIF